MRITLVCVGKIKEKFFQQGIDEYTKRLSRYAKIDVIETPDEKTPDNAGEALCQIIKQKEGERIMKHLREDAFVIALAIEGEMLSSEELAKKVDKLALEGKSHIQFIIGGSLGLHKDVVKRADYLLSFSRMTFPHQMMRQILLEQIYRAYRINNNQPYHK